MPPRSSWKGFIRLSLVSIPVRSFTAAVSASEPHLRQLHKECHSPIRYRKVCPIHGEVTDADIVSGYEYTKGSFVIVTQEERDGLYVEGDRSVNIDNFVPLESIEPVYFTGKCYYLLPDMAAGLKPYVLLQKTMAKKSLAATGTVVLYGREQVALLRPMKRMLNLHLLNYPGAIKGTEEFEAELTEPELREEELRLTETLIDATAVDEFDPSRYQDAYAQKLTELVQAKVEGKEISVPPPSEEPQVINLMEALKRSVAQAGERGKARNGQGGEGKGSEGRDRVEEKKRTGSPAAHRKMAPSARHSSGVKGKKKLG